MPQLIWSRTALADMQRQYHFLAAKDKNAAMRMVAAIRKAVLPLAARPEMGRPVPELGGEYRRWVVRFGSGSYRVTYRLTGGAVVLLTVRHEREAVP